MFNNSTYATVDKFMRTDLIILKGDIPLTVACRRFSDHKVGSLLIETSDNKFGCLTKTDIINVIGRGEDPGLIKSQDVSSIPLFTIHKNESLEKSMLIMAKNNLKRLFIVDSSEKILGVISSSDIIRIAPGLLGIAREEAIIKNAEASDPTSKNKFSGVCDDCKQFTEYLREIGGFALCDNCIKTTDIEEDIDNLSTDDE